MTQLLDTTGDGRAHFYHFRRLADGTTDEHAWVGRVRANSRHFFLYCHLCDSRSRIARGQASEESRFIEAAIAAGELKVLAVAEESRESTVRLDPIAAAIEDGALAAASAAPSGLDVETGGSVDDANKDGSAARRVFIDKLRDDHADVWPSGTVCTVKVGESYEQQEQDGSGGFKVIGAIDAASLEEGA